MLKSILTARICAEAQNGAGYSFPEGQASGKCPPIIFDGTVMDGEFCADLIAGLVFGDHMQDPSFAMITIGYVCVPASTPPPRQMLPAALPMSMARERPTLQ